MEERDGVLREGNKYWVYEVIDDLEGEGRGFKAVEKMVGDKGEEFWEYQGMGFEEVVKGVERKKCGRKDWMGPKKRESVL